MSDPRITSPPHSPATVDYSGGQSTPDSRPAAVSALCLALEMCQPRQLTTMSHQADGEGRSLGHIPVRG